MEVKIRKATLKDRDTLLKMMFKICIYESKISPVKVANSRTKYFLKKNINSWITNKEYLFLVAEIEDNIEGYIFGWREYVTEACRNNYVGYICDCYVNEKFRKQAICKKLIEEITTKFKKKKIKELKLIALKGSISVKIWKKIGFKEIYSEMRKVL